MWNSFHMSRCTWNYLYVSCNVSYFAYVNLVETFLWNSPSVVYSSMTMLSVNNLIHGALSLRQGCQNRDPT